MAIGDTGDTGVANRDQLHIEKVKRRRQGAVLGCIFIHRKKTLFALFARKHGYGILFLSPSLDRKLHRFIYQIGSWDGSYYRYTRCSLGLRKFNVGINVFIFEKPIASPNGNCDGGGKWQNDFFPFSLRDPLSMQTPPPRDIYVKFVSN